MLSHYTSRLQERYELKELPLNMDDPSEVVQVMEMIGKKRGALVSGGKVDLDKTSLLFLRDLQSGKLGRISLEQPTSMEF